MSSSTRFLKYGGSAAVTEAHELGTYEDQSLMKEQQGRALKNFRSITEHVNKRALGRNNTVLG